MIAVPDEVHQTVLTAAVDSAIPFLYEPPIAIYRDQIPVMIDLLLKAKQVTYADLELGCHPAVTRIIQIIKNGLIGNLHNVTITLHSDFGHSESDLCLINRMSCWYVDVLNRITGTIPKRVLTLDGYGNSGRMQTISTGIYDYNGIWGEFKANINSTKELSISLEINGDEGIINFDYFSGEIRYRSLQQKEWLIESCPSLLPYADYPGVRESVSSFLNAVECGNRSMGNAQMVAQLNQIGMAADESKDTGNWAEVKVLTSTKKDKELF
jgi:predicted dehydrogenase